MWALDPPEIELDETFQACISRIRSNPLRARLAAALPDIGQAADDYDARARNAELHLIAPAPVVAGNVTTDEMVAVYDGRMAKPAAPGRGHYDYIKSLAKNEICPFCGHRQVRTLDHVLPKRRFPIFAVTPINLVPACSDCNMTKSTAIGAVAEEMFLHPYFDNVESDLWLKASVIERLPAVAVFHVEAPAHWPAVLASRVSHHFERLGLARLYSQEAAQELSSIRHSMQKLFDAGGANLVRRHLEREHVSRDAFQVNSWRTALYAALKESDWFIAQGFRMP